MSITLTTADQVYPKVAHVIPAIEWATMADDVEAILRLKQERNAVILGHNYMSPEIYYGVSDIVGDSLALAREATEVEAEVIVLAGVHFMAETVKLLNPSKTVLIPDLRSGCSLAESITAEDVRELRRRHPGVPVVTYVNTSAAVKAESDICCTSANAVKVVKSLTHGKRILFVPDRHLAAYVARETGRPLLANSEPRSAKSERSGPEFGVRSSAFGIVPWEGFCYVHASFRAADVERARKDHPGAFVVVHPECPLETIDAADAAASTSGMVRLAREHHEIVLGTEAGMCNRIRRDLPEVKCWPLRRTALCRNMKLTRLEDVRAALEGAVPEISIPDTVAVRARQAIDRMMAV